MRARVSALNNVDLPTFGNPTIAILMPIKLLREVWLAALAMRFGGGPAAVQLVHRRLLAAAEQDGNDVRGIGHRGPDRRLVLAGRPLQHVVDHFGPVA